MKDNRFLPFREGDVGGDFDGVVSGVDVFSAPSEMEGKLGGNADRVGE